MFNRGATWSGFIRQLRKKRLPVVPAAPTVVEIGHGDGHFLAGSGGSAPGAAISDLTHMAPSQTGASDVLLRAALFDPFRSHFRTQAGHDRKPSRSGASHRTRSVCCRESTLPRADWPRDSLYFEVPCIDRAVEAGRLGDFYYEHYSHNSLHNRFKGCFARSQFRLEELGPRLQWRGRLCVPQHRIFRRSDFASKGRDEFFPFRPQLSRTNFRAARRHLP